MASLCVQKTLSGTGPPEDALGLACLSRGVVWSSDVALNFVGGLRESPQGLALLLGWVVNIRAVFLINSILSCRDPNTVPRSSRWAFI